MGSLFHGDSMEAFLSSYTISDTVIGNGARGTVKLGKSIKGEEEVAIREVEKSQYGGHIEFLYREMDILQQLSHKNIVKLRSWYEDKKIVRGVMDYVQYGSLLERLLEEDFYSEGLAQEIVQVLLEALSYCYKKGITHRDLTPMCILLGNTTNIAGGLVLVNFGEATRVPIGEIGRQTLETHFFDHPEWRAPEILNKKKIYNHKVDIWSLGVIAAVLVSGGVSLFLGENEVETIKNVRRGNFQWLPEENWKNVSPQAKHFIVSCLIKDPLKRSDYHELMEHEWVKGERMNTMISSKGLVSVAQVKERVQNVVHALMAADVFLDLAED
mmetsp:Transcript_16106/g.18238  ORF Transcript_16106/g.18238 Transcript_16106/m.18238 type:complete len:327 (+) Transcript_16106:272-1252(+)|eukprot:CAMPEP_0184048374 /NCGR_PEP_ID=MMETSP0956-20121227/2736_1 /TAXON_ID=627963 /ORGANISM="Aplanochytrium sp, Strain PBS07" /LENGTH=326 /DNA_ID=CAMNT_0026340381 /DNA_START=142 /DNA_END=1122 /DNA_ORIENTATION=+